MLLRFKLPCREWRQCCRIRLDVGNVPQELWSGRLADGERKWLGLRNPVWFTGVRAGVAGADQATWELFLLMINWINCHYYFLTIHLYSSVSHFTYLATPTEWIFKCSYHNKNSKWENSFNKYFLLFTYLDLNFTSLL